MVAMVIRGILEEGMAALEEKGVKGKQEEDGKGVREDWDEERKEPKKASWLYL